jgi:signal transduction histidine kinase
MVLSDPDATTDTFRETCQQVLEEGEQQEQLIAALLALAQGQRGVERRELVDLAVVSSSVVEAHEIEAVTQGVQLDVSLTPAKLTGDRRLIERLVSNLLENALRHNVPGGRVRLEVKPLGVGATLMIANTGPRVPADHVERLLQPFQRLAQDRVGHRDGLGLGLSIVSAIAAAHDATLAVEPGADGGLQIDVRFPRVPDSFPRPSESVDAPGESEQRPAVTHPM